MLEPSKVKRRPAVEQRCVKLQQLYNRYPLLDAFKYDICSKQGHVQKAVDGKPVAGSLQPRASTGCSDTSLRVSQGYWLNKLDPNGVPPQTWPRLSAKFCASSIHEAPKPAMLIFLAVTKLVWLHSAR